MFQDLRVAGRHRPRECLENPNLCIQGNVHTHRMRMQQSPLAHTPWLYAWRAASKRSSSWLICPRIIHSLLKSENFSHATCVKDDGGRYG